MHKKQAGPRKVMVLNHDIKLSDGGNNDPPNLLSNNIPEHTEPVLASS